MVDYIIAKCSNLKITNDEEIIVAFDDVGNDDA